MDDADWIEGRIIMNTVAGMIRSVHVARRLLVHANEVRAPREEPLSGYGSRSPILFCFLIGVAALAIRVVIGPAGTFDYVVSTACGIALGWLVSRRRVLNKKALSVWNMEREVPNLVERIVMGVTAGLDVIPAMKAACQGLRNQEKPSEVEGLLKQVIAFHEKGLSFSKAIETVCERIEVPSVRHAFAHLGIAQQQGGELMRPLRELADATQLAFQERIDEEIAKLPVKATVPLLVTFAGLIIFFVTIPVIQVSSMTKKITASLGEESK